MVVNELRGEKIDVVQWVDGPARFVANALAPAKVKEVRVDATTGTAQVIVPDYQLSLAIGKEGQNARLAAKLTGLPDRHQERDPGRRGRPAAPRRQGGRGRVAAEPEAPESRRPERRPRGRGGRRGQAPRSEGGRRRPTVERTDREPAEPDGAGGGRRRELVRLARADVRRVPATSRQGRLVRVVAGPRRPGRGRPDGRARAGEPTCIATRLRRGRRASARSWPGRCGRRWTGEAGRLMHAS